MLKPKKIIFVKKLNQKNNMSLLHISFYNIRTFNLVS